MDDEQNSFKKVVSAAVVVMLVALMFIALLYFFFSMQEAISALFDPRFAPLMQALFSLAVLGTGVYFIKVFLAKS